MKNTWKYLRFSLIIALMLSICGCGGVAKSVEKEYYMDVNNYITEEAIVYAIDYHEDLGYISFGLTSISTEYQGNNFIIRGKSFDKVIENDVLGKIKINDVIEFTSAPAYFGNGYVMPIVQLSIDGEILLSFEEGYANLLELY